MIKIVGIADTHGSHEEVKVPLGDILVVAGDFCTYGKLDEVIRFNTWLGKLTHTYKIVVAGNHDRICEHNHGLIKKIFSNAIYLDNESVRVAGINFWGSPYSPEFNGWAFAYPKNSSKGKLIWEAVPNKTNILITHGVPTGRLGKMPDHYEGPGEDLGCPQLRQRILELPNLKASFHGHIHEGFGKEIIGKTVCMNVSIMDGDYEVKHPGQVFDYD